MLSAPLTELNGWNVVVTPPLPGDSVEKPLDIQLCMAFIHDEKSVGVPVDLHAPVIFKVSVATGSGEPDVSTPE